MDKRDNRIFWLLKFLLAACLATPLLAWSGVIFPYTAPKILAFRVLVELAAVFYLYLALKYPAHFFTPLFKGGRGGILNLSILVFFAISFLSAIFGADLYNSWWSGLERGMGVWGLAHFTAWFFMLSAIFKDRPDRLRLIKVSVAVGAAVAASALIQRLGGLGGLLPATSRIYGLIGNAGFLGSYLVFNVFLAGYLAILSLREAKQRRVHFFGYCFLFLVLLLALTLTGTRGAWLGLLTGIIVFLLLMIFVRRQEACPPEFVSGSKNTRSRNKTCPELVSGFGMTNKKKIYIFIFLALIFVLAASLFMLRPISLSDTTAQSRLILWQDSWRAWQERPWLGYGPENFEAGMGKYLSPRLASFESFIADRAHNFIFDYGVATGWLGLLGYLAIFVVAGWALAKGFLERHPERSEGSIDFLSRHSGIQNGKRYFSIILLSLLAAYLVQNFFIFDSFVSYLMLFFVLAVVNNICHPERSAQLRVDEHREPEREGSMGLFKKLLIFLFLVSCFLFLYFFNFKPFLAANYAHQILSLPPAKAAPAGPLLKGALVLDTFASPEVAYQASLDYIDKINQNPVLAKNEEFYNIASIELARIISRSPNQPGNYLALAWLDLYFSGAVPQRMSDAIDLGNKAKELSPNKKDAYLILAAAYALSGQNDEAQKIISQAEKIDGKMGEEVKKYWESLK